MGKSDEEDGSDWWDRALQEEGLHIDRPVPQPQQVAKQRQGRRPRREAASPGEDIAEQDNEREEEGGEDDDPAIRLSMASSACGLSLSMLNGVICVGDGAGRSSAGQQDMADACRRGRGHIRALPERGVQGQGDVLAMSEVLRAGTTK
ncbi:hypothetical protein GUJ93_ZPchr0014g47466 [Zizania palustris]|uniref:Uncharacterized protein n=1 Tax=Zizania palustris TaxID=103762 RepID=A0A8J5T9W9_ZIZPA|nr:hypothetical protein GUJ93_ZPchr0014g47466 [Zizania palustris]